MQICFCWSLWMGSNWSTLTLIYICDGSRKINFLYPEWNGTHISGITSRKSPNLKFFFYLIWTLRLRDRLNVHGWLINNCCKLYIIIITSDALVMDFIIQSMHRNLVSLFIILSLKHILSRFSKLNGRTFHCGIKIIRSMHLY